MGHGSWQKVWIDLWLNTKRDTKTHTCTWKGTGDQKTRIYNNHLHSHTLRVSWIQPWFPLRPTWCFLKYFTLVRSKDAGPENGICLIFSQSHHVILVVASSHPSLQIFVHLLRFAWRMARKPCAVSSVVPSPPCVKQRQAGWVSDILAGGEEAEARLSGWW